MTERSDRANRGYAICTSGRSGSNVLCQYLASTGLLGKPLEYIGGKVAFQPLDERADAEPVAADCLSHQRDVVGLNIGSGELDAIIWSGSLHEMSADDAASVDPDG
jgi:LPS sulfotransferase NodH